MPQRKPHNPNTKYGRRKLREEAARHYESLSPEGKGEHDSTDVNQTMNSTARKLHEAAYFFDSMDIDDPYFDFNLSAFLNAARSVLWVMRCEFNNAQGWEEWFKNYPRSLSAELLLKETNDLRIKTAKQLGVKTDYFFLETNLRVDEQYYEELRKFCSLADGEYELQITPILDEAQRKPSTGDSVSFIGHINRKEKPYSNERQLLKSRCLEYLNYLSGIVNACISLFSSPSPVDNAKE